MKNFVYALVAILMGIFFTACSNGGGTSPIFTTTTTSQTNLNDGLIAHYEFEDNADDSSGNNNNGAEYGGVTYTDGIIGKAASFDGVDSYIETNTFTDKWDTWSVSVFIKAKDTSKNAMIVERERIGGYYDFNLFVKSDAKVQVETDNSDDTYTISNTSIDTDKWYHLIAIYDGTKRYIYM